MQMRLWPGVFVACGGALGALARGALSIPFSGFSSNFALFLINVAGAFLLGWLNGFPRKNKLPHQVEISLFVGTGFLGSFTTFSSLVYTTVELGIGWGIFYIGTTLMAGLLFALIGLQFGKNWQNYRMKF